MFSLFVIWQHQNQALFKCLFCVCYVILLPAEELKIEIAWKFKFLKMAYEASSVDGERCKRIKLSHEDGETTNTKAEDLSAYARINSLEGFKFKSILHDNHRSKSVSIEALFEETGDLAVVLLDKLPINKENVDKLLNNADLALNLKSQTHTESNVIEYACYPNVDRGGKLWCCSICFLLTITAFNFVYLLVSKIGF